MHRTSIGILGGVGAIASARFHLDLVTEWARVHGARTDDDFPHITHVSQSLGLGVTGVVDDRATEEALWHSLRILEGCDHIAVVCNSVTNHVAQVPGVLTPVAACALALRGVSRAWLLASESTIRDRIYQDAYPEIEWQPLVVTAQIQEAIAGRRMSDPFDDKGAGDLPIVLGCTELSTAHLGWANTISPTDEMIRILCSTS